MWKKIILIVLALIPVVVVVRLYFLGKDSQKMSPKMTGLKNGQLNGCPDKPNCVSSQAPDQDHKIEPIHYQGQSTDIINKLKKILNADEAFSITKQKADYIGARYISGFFGFIDDVEFHFPDEKKIIHIRSASRVGYNDLGANRKRLEKIRALLAESD